MKNYKLLFVFLVFFTIFIGGCGNSQSFSQTATVSELTSDEESNLIDELFSDENSVQTTKTRALSGKYPVLSKIFDRLLVLNDENKNRLIRIKNNGIDGYKHKSGQYELYYVFNLGTLSSDRSGDFDGIFYLKHYTTSKGTYYHNLIIVFNVNFKKGKYQHKNYAKGYWLDLLPYPKTVLTSKYSQSRFATTNNAFRAYKGQCTWYAYGRIVELAENGYIPYSTREYLKQKLYVEHTSGRDAKNWPTLLGGNWFNTNNAVFPKERRKAGMLASWVAGKHGHVGIVEEVSEDKTRYRLTDFNRAETEQYKSKWYDFEGTSDRLLGVYPRFLDLDNPGWTVTKSKVIRSADPLNIWKRFGDMNIDKLENGKASHMSPAEIIYYSYKENNINPVIVLSKLQQEQGLIESDPGIQIEAKLFRAMGYGALESGDLAKWYGFYPQIVSVTWRADQSRADNESFHYFFINRYTPHEESYNQFVNIYKKYASVMNSIAYGYNKNETNYPASYDFYNDFRDIGINDIQKFLERYNGVLKDKKLFQKAPYSVTIYGNYKYN